ncbi:hydroxyisourate hydrolase [Hoeflea alexandrii]|uniref:hydroxyisourate hydrolase n=1 Tax=Hoeflea alexandrii TaxID=288436 RepID=UPI0022B0129D|nr:hydroxyisourate hydrolase [Hoeflea alexandrii]MCZ4291620.1 hydroxyisourate hydrolase [Hoeflea alexandrii]
MTLKFTTHVLNGTDGTHAAGVGLSLCNRCDGTLLFSGVTDAGGRLQAEIPTEAIADDGALELVIRSRAFWEGRNIPRSGPQIVDEVAVRITLPERSGHYHLPVMLSPNSFSGWWSS